MRRKSNRSQALVKIGERKHSNACIAGSCSRKCTISGATHESTMKRANRLSAPFADGDFRPPTIWNDTQSSTPSLSPNLRRDSGNRHPFLAVCARGHFGNRNRWPPIWKSTRMMRRRIVRRPKRGFRVNCVRRNSWGLSNWDDTFAATRRCINATFV